MNEAEYDYCIDKLRPPIAKLSQFIKSDRFGNNGIFGDIYDSRRETRFGQPKLSTLNVDKANDAIDTFQMKRVQDSKTFGKYVTRDISALEGVTGSLMVDTIYDNSPEKLREQSGFNLKAYKKLKEFQGKLPKMERVNHQDYLPNFIKNKLNKKKVPDSLPTAKNQMTSV